MSLAQIGAVDGSDWVISGPLELSNMTEVKEAITQEQGKHVLPKYLLDTYDYLKNVAIENLKVKIPLGQHGDTFRLRLVQIHSYDHISISYGHISMLCIN